MTGKKMQPEAKSARRVSHMQQSLSEAEYAAQELVTILASSTAGCTIAVEAERNRLRAALSALDHVEKAVTEIKDAIADMDKVGEERSLRTVRDALRRVKEVLFTARAAHK